VADEVTATTVAQWMVEQIHRSSTGLEQEWAAARIRQLFGRSFIDELPSGNRGINQRVLGAFKELAGDEIVWDRVEKAWRKRRPGDAPGRFQKS
jgi:hypothetical protein